MNKNAKAWVKALRGKKYTQTTGRLRGIDEEGREGFCCLGVACDLYAQKVGGNWTKRPVKKTFIHDGDSYGFVTKKGKQSEVSELPEEVRDWLGLNYSDGALRDPSRGPYSLADANDSHAMNFSAIADFIEENEDILFGEGN